MKISITKKELLKQVTIAQKAISSRTTMQILEGILFEAKDGYLTLSSTDFQLSIITKTFCDIEKEGKCVLNSQLFGNIVRKLPDSMIHLELKDKLMHMTCDGLNYNLSCYEASEYPSMPQIEEENSIILTKDQVNLAFKYTAFSASLDETRPALTGILLDAKADKINFVSLDGYRLSKLSFKNENSSEIYVIIPTRAFSELTKILSEEDEEIKVVACQGNIMFEFGMTKFFSRLLSGKFVDYDGILSDKYTSHVIVDRSMFINALERISLLTREDKAKLVKVIFNNSFIELKSNTDLGDGYERVDADLQGDEIKIAYNNRYVLDGIKAIDSEKIKINLKGTVNTSTIEGIDSNVDYTYLVLPVRLKSEDF